MDFDFSELDRMNDEMRELKAKYAKKVENKLFDNVSWFFEKYDSLLAFVFWDQYTPYFSDGDPCVFSKHEPYYLFDYDVNGYENNEEDLRYEGSDNIYYYSKDTLLGYLEEWKKYREDPDKWVIEHAQKEFAAKGEVYSHKLRRNCETLNEFLDTYSHLKRSVPCFHDEEYIERILATQCNMKKDFPDFEEDLKRVLDMIRSIPDDISNEIFGDHVRVIIDKNGVRTGELDHD